MEADNLAELGQGCANLLYDIPNIRAEGGSPPAELRIGWLRSVGNIQQAFAVNSFTHELASAAGRDPAAYLLELLGPARHWKPDKNPLFFGNAAKQLKKFPVDTGRLSDVTRRAMQAADWDQPLGQGRGRGIACHRSFSSYVASVAEVLGGTTGQKSTSTRIISVADVGQVRQPGPVCAPNSKARPFSRLGFTLYGEISTKEGRVEQSNFHDYRVLRLHETPVIEIELVASTVRPTGVGEPGTPTIAPALCNAIFDASGQRVRQLPLIKQGLVV